MVRISDILTVLIISLLCFYGNGLEDFVDCGGFVKLSPQLAQYTEDKKLDYSKIRVHLLNQEGTKKDTAECAPNGYYILPIYEKGTFTIKIDGPEGWLFSPSQFDVTVGNNQNQCSQDFELTGFSIIGKVTGDEGCKIGDDVAGVRGVVVKLIPQTAGLPVKAQSTLSGNDGRFFFANTVPGSYLVQATHPNWTLKSTSAMVDHAWGTAFVKENFVVSGYTIDGRVLEGAEDGNPVQGVTFALYDEEGRALDFDCPKLPAESLPTDRTNALCGVKSNNGLFSFDKIPCGKYVLVPYYKSGSTVYDVIPKQLNLDLRQGGASISQPFLVRGFSVYGKVKSLSGKGIEGVSIKAKSLSDGTERVVVTDSNGYYTLDQVSSDQYEITAEKDKYVFSSLSKQTISPSMVIPDITATSFQICGKVYIPQPPSGVKVESRKVVLKSESGTKVSTMTDPSGHYCFTKVVPGKYFVIPDISGIEVEAGLHMTDSEIEVLVDSQPVLDVNFEQARLLVSGTVKCLEPPCDTSISVSLSAVGRVSRVTTALAIGQDGSSEDQFIFKGILPGKYELTINHENWCWEKETEIIDVTSKDVTDIQFVQVGYVFECKSTHALDLVSVDKAHTFQVKKGKNRFCLPQPGVYDFEPKSCFKFESDKYTYDTFKPSVLKLNARHYRVLGKVNVDAAYDISTDPQVSVEVKSKSNVDPKLADITKIDDRTYEFSYWAELEEKLTFTPKSSTLFFYPQSIIADVDSDGCPPALNPFVGRPGIYLSGTVTPALKGVKIDVLFADTLQSIGLTGIKTNAKGEYNAGPLYDDRKYVIKAEKEGYNLVEVEGQTGNFQALKLGHVEVTVTHQGAPLAGVVLSLSGSSGYKNNNATDSTGSFKFGSLFPAEYFLRPILREYSFDPTSVPISITEGLEKSVSFTATRVAYIVSGKVSSLSGEPEKLVTVEAVGDGLYEETQTDVTGTYRLRGLLPGKSYNIQVKLNTTSSSSSSSSGKSIKLSRAEPSVVPITIGTIDVENVDFIAFRKINSFEISGVVATTGQVLSTLTVQLYTIGEESKPSASPVAEQRLGPVGNFFSFERLDYATKYLVKLKTDLSEKSFVYKLPSVTVDNTNHSHHVFVQLDFSAEEKKVEIQVEQESFLSLTLILLIVAGAYYYKSIILYINSFKKKESNEADDWSQDFSHLRNNKKHKKN
eukprot:TRINITY_DN8096_c0_g1_i1.p1 TRINITY_DN8096_c0_g1~~TRINITY_DN8096_c0_g1_i1.p1  ORF type:complete len:1191 (+),score=340.35 TRINITY_DN8096_c0_g1_i1:31-3603(+)